MERREAMSADAGQRDRSGRSCNAQEAVEHGAQSDAHSRRAPQGLLAFGPLPGSAIVQVKASAWWHQQEPQSCHLTRLEDRCVQAP